MFVELIMFQFVPKPTFRLLAETANPARNSLRGQFSPGQSMWRMLSVSSRRRSMLFIFFLPSFEFLVIPYPHRPAPRPPGIIAEHRLILISKVFVVDHMKLA